MARQTFSISFYCFANDARKKTGLAPVKACIIINGQRTYCQLQRQYKPDEFKRAIAERSENEIQKYINQQRMLFNEYADEMQAEGYELTADRLKEFFKRGGVRKEYTIRDMFSEYTGYIEERYRNGEIRDRRTLTQHKKTEELFYELTDNTPDIAVNRITTTDLKRFESGLLKRYQRSTAAGYLKKIKSFFKFAFDNGKSKKNPAAQIRVRGGTDPDRIKYLTQSQLNQIRTTNYKAKYVKRTADLYLFSCYTGLAYIDLKGLTEENFYKREDGTIYIKGHRHKTGKPYTTILFKDAKRIAIEYNFHLPTISHTNYNKFLKKVAKEANIISPSLSAHTARHTFAVFLLNARDKNGNPIPEETIMKMCGWTNPVQMRQYAKLLDDSVFKDTSFIEHLNPKDSDKLRSTYNTAEKKPRKARRSKKAKDTMTIDLTLDQLKDIE